MLPATAMFEQIAYIPVNKSYARMFRQKHVLGAV